MKIKMLKTTRGARDGHKLEVFEEGETYDLGGTPREIELVGFQDLPRQVPVR